MKNKGDCIRVACENIIANKSWMFCHARVMGNGILKGHRILHAWNEVGDIVFDFSNGNKIVMRKERYYKIAKIKEKNITRNTSEETMRLMFKTKSYGGWING